jgi:uncharacterized protein YqeY
MQESIERDLKTAMLSGDKDKAEVLRGLKNALQYEAVNSGIKKEELSKEQIQKVFAREAKKRQEAADLYKNAGETARADKELSEKAVIDGYLPEQLPEEEVKKIVEEEVAKLDSPAQSDMGRIIGAVKARTAGQADGALIARLVKEKIAQ